MTIRRGDVVLVDFDPTEESEQRGTRPAVVIQSDAGNRAAPTTIVAPLTTSYDPERVAPYEAELLASETVVGRDSVALLNQTRTIPIEDRVSRNFGRLPPSGDEMEAIERGIEYSLGLR